MLAQATLSNWANEFAKWAPPLRVVPYDGGPEERRALRAEHLDGVAGGGNAAFNVLVTHYDLVIRDKAFLRKVWAHARMHTMCGASDGHCRVSADTVHVWRKYGVFQALDVQDNRAVTA